MNQLNFVTRDDELFVATWDEHKEAWSAEIGDTLLWTNVTSKLLDRLITHYTQCVTQAEVNRFLDISFFVAPGRTYSDRMADLLWRFPETPSEELDAMSANWERQEPAPVVQAEIAPTYRLCNDCSAVLDASRQHCVACGHQWSVF